MSDCLCLCVCFSVCLSARLSLTVHLSFNFLISESGFDIFPRIVRFRRGLNGATALVSVIEIPAPLLLLPRPPLPLPPSVVASDREPFSPTPDPPPRSSLASLHFTRRKNAIIPDVSPTSGRYDIKSKGKKTSCARDFISHSAGPSMRSLVMTVVRLCSSISSLNAWFPIQVGPWTNVDGLSRQVWCQQFSSSPGSSSSSSSLSGQSRRLAPRIGGMNVTGGCDEEKRPPSLYECGPLPTGQVINSDGISSADDDDDNNNNNNQNNNKRKKKNLSSRNCAVHNSVCSSGRCVCLGDYASVRNKTTGTLMECRKGKPPSSSSSSFDSPSPEDYGQAVRSASSLNNRDRDNNDPFDDGDSRHFSWGHGSAVTELMGTGGGGGGGGVIFSDDALSPSLNDFRRPDGHLTFDLNDAGIGGDPREETRRRDHGIGGAIIAPNRLWLYAVITASCVLLVFFSIALYISWTRCKLSTS